MNEVYFQDQKGIMDRFLTNSCESDGIILFGGSEVCVCLWGEGGWRRGRL